MDARRIRNLLPALYAAAVIGALLSRNSTAIAAVVIIGAIVVGAGYAALSGGVNSNPDRAARRAGRRNRH